MVYTRFYDGKMLPFDRAQALRYFGYGKTQQPTEEVEKLFDECVQTAVSSCACRVCYAEFEIVRKKNSEVLNLGFTETNSKSLALNLDGCHKVIAFAATVGMEIDRLIARYSTLSPGKAYAFQAIGAERIETLCDAFNEEINQKYEREGLFTRPRFSCGYGDFPLDKQRDFFSALDCVRKIGLTLNDSLLMNPSKSVTALIGLSNIPCARRGNKCVVCYNVNCPFKE